jgi:hypothetical protein
MCIKLVIIKKKLYYDARPTKYRDVSAMVSHLGVDVD